MRKNPRDVPSVEPSLTKRELFALLLLAGANANPVYGNLPAIGLIKAAIGQADVLIKELADDQEEE